MRYFLGIDGGGTKTHALVSDEKGNLIGFGKAGCGNFEVFGWYHAKNEILKAANEALAHGCLSAGSLTFSFFGLAGADRHYDHTMLKNEIKNLNLFQNFNVKNDSFVALRGGTTKPYGVVVVSGTGTVAVGRSKKGKEHRAGGLGANFGDAGSGPDIMRRAVSAVVRENDGRGKHTQLTKVFHKIFKCKSTDEFIDSTYRNIPSSEQMAIIIQSVYECAIEKDTMALEICNTIAAEIASSAIAVISRLSMFKDSFDVVLAGSIHKENGKVLKPLISRIVKSVAPHANVHYPAFPPVAGAVLLAMEGKSMKITAQHYENIRRTIKIMEKKQHRQP